jgi:ATP-dependent HslUV protease ATP-binding subunit HslU
VRDLVETAVKMVREQRVEQIRDQAETRVRERLLDLLTGEKGPFRRIVAGFGDTAGAKVEEGGQPSRDELRRRYERGELDDKEVEIEVSIKPAIDGIYGMMQIDEQALGGMRDMLEKILPQKNRRKKMKVADARRILLDEESESMLDMEKITLEAIELAEQSGIIFIDEIDKIAGHGNAQGGPDVSRQGVQRDILPIVEGSTVQTKRGSVRTDHILFIAAGAFHMTKPSDLIPELQGRFPLRVELEPLTTADFERILVEPDHSLIDQYKALLQVDGVLLDFGKDGIAEIAASAFSINERTENIGARRLHTIMERVLQDVLFDAPDVARGEVTIDREYVRSRLEPFMKHEDLSRFIL